MATCNSTDYELRFFTNPLQWSHLEIRLTHSRKSIISQKQFIVTKRPISFQFFLLFRCFPVFSTLGFKGKCDYTAKIPLSHEDFPVFTLDMSSISISPRSNISGERSNFLTVDRPSTIPAMITASTYSLSNLAEGTVSEEGVEITKLLEEHERLEKLKTPDSGALIQKETTETGQVYYQNILMEFLTTILIGYIYFFLFYILLFAISR